MRRTMKFGLAGAAAIAALAVSVGTAQALQIVQIMGYNTSDSLNSSTNYTGAVTHSMGDVTGGNRNFSKFDSNLGTLNSVVIGISSIRMLGSSSANFRDDDNFAVVEGITRLQSMRIAFASAGFSDTRTRSNIFDTCNDTSSLGNDAICTASVNFNSALSNVNDVLTGAILGNYTGVGSWLMDVDHFGDVYNNETDGDNGYINSRNASLSSSGTIRVTYHYTAPPPPQIPEPATLALFGLGLAGLGLTARRRKTA